MERTFTEDFGRHYQRGETRDYPRSFWNDLAARAGRPLESFTTDPQALVMAGLPEPAQASEGEGTSERARESEDSGARATSRKRARK